MSVRFGIAVFPGTWSDRDCIHAVGLTGADAVPLWHADRDLKGCDVVILPGGFAYGDYLRAGAIARFAPLMEAVGEHARAGGPVLGICNGFQILCEAGLLPGALLRNSSLQFRCQPTWLRLEAAKGPFLSSCRPGQLLRVPVSHGEGRFYADRECLAQLNGEGRVAFRYSDRAGALTTAANPNGSLENIAGILNPEGNVLGMMPHPERACEELLGSDHGLALFNSAIHHLGGAPG
ncbi:MAG TPA: phosphoribosylformylglycinamidine synthase subunit PurQ [Candidatus Dormibacteraeota bacterium]|nr:phosphoribosylformylglycinamidine synthase subunit PurQ [Candidatus Dormibacteraeota bacterium]